MQETATIYLRPALIETGPARIRHLIRANHSGLLVTHCPRGSEASHIPFTLTEDGDGFTFVGHLAEAGPLPGGSGGRDAAAVPRPDADRDLRVPPDAGADRGAVERWARTAQ